MSNITTEMMARTLESNFTQNGITAPNGQAIPIELCKQMAPDFISAYQNATQLPRGRGIG